MRKWSFTNEYSVLTQECNKKKYFIYNIMYPLTLDAQNIRFTFQNLLIIKDQRCSFINSDKKDQKKDKVL